LHLYLGIFFAVLVKRIIDDDNKKKEKTLVINHDHCHNKKKFSFILALREFIIDQILN
jgi:hypothetical protein